MAEVVWIWAAMAGMGASLCATFGGVCSSRRRDSMVLSLLVFAVALLSVALIERWLRLGHGPFLTLFEVLLSNVFSLGLIYAVAFWRLPHARSGAPIVILVLLVLGVWMLNTSTEAKALPATYDNPWIWVHVLAGKFFLGLLLTATGCAGALLANRIAASQQQAVDDLLWRLASYAFVFQTLMLVAGAAWARDAWGRFWAWDPLETWSFLVWLALAACLHCRVTYRWPLPVGWVVLNVIFALAVVTFLGIPFLSVAAHKGVM